MPQNAFFKESAMGDISSFLFPDSGAVEGCARIFDFDDCLQDFNHSRSPAESDSAACSADWKQVGVDLRSAQVKFEKCQSDPNADADRP